MEIDIVLFYNQIKLLCICFRLSPVGMKFENKSRGFLLGSPAFKLADELEFFRIMCRDQRIQRIVGMPKPMVDDDMGGFLTDQLLQDIFRFSVLGKTTAFFPFDGVTDVRNFGAIARSAECAGVHGLIMPVKNSAPVNADSMKTSAGALSIIPVSRVGSIRNTIRILQNAGLQIVAASEKSELPLYKADLNKPTALVLGSEDTGISKEVLKMCDVQLAIPLKGTIESLNVGAAAAVMLFEAVRQRSL